MVKDKNSKSLPRFPRPIRNVQKFNNMAKEKSSNLQDYDEANCDKNCLTFLEMCLNFYNYGE